MRKRLCQEKNAVDMDVHRGRYDYADIGQRIMYTSSSGGLYKRAPGFGYPSVAEKDGKLYIA